MNYRSTIFIIALIVPSFLIGCGKAPEPQFRLNAVEVLAAERVNLAEGEKISDENLRQVGSILTALFGTPDQPKFPFLLDEEDPAHQVISQENLERAAGPVSLDKAAKQTGLFRQHCVHCHGISGDGAGSTARTLNPYPRDFRLGKFKYKSTPLGKRPTDEDLKRVLLNGVPGTAMLSFRILPESDIAALVDYVKYLSIRGEVERLLIAYASRLEADEKLIDLSLAASEKTREDFEDRLFELIDDSGYNSRVLPKWLNRERHVTRPAPAPASFASAHPDHKKLILRGKALFHGAGGCIQCHGETGLGDGQTETYDDWTQWAKDAKAVPDQPETYADFAAVGALNPRYLRPRNLNMKTYRGGNHPDDIYRRVLNGIEGTPMPSATTLQKDTDDIWAIVAYVKSIPYEADNVVPKATNDRNIN